jgi:hypothetical protein
MKLAGKDCLDGELQVVDLLVREVEPSRQAADDEAHDRGEAPLRGNRQCDGV